MLHNYQRSKEAQAALRMQYLQIKATNVVAQLTAVREKLKPLQDLERRLVADLYDISREQSKCSDLS